MKNISFISKYHQRYESSIPIKEIQKSNRTIKIEENINGCKGYNLVKGDGYIVTIFNSDENHPLFNNIQMSPKPMRIISKTNDKIILRGYNVEAMSPFGWVDFDGSDYGLTINLKSGQIENCILHMHDRNIDIVYLQDDI